MTAIFKKELASYLHSVTGWLFMAATIGFFADRKSTRLNSSH